MSPTLTAYWKNTKRALSRADRAIQCRYDKLSDGAEWAASQWWGFLAFVTFSWICYTVWGWAGVDGWFTVPMATLFLIDINQSRRGSKATQVKLDAVDPDPGRNRLEDKTEREIEAARDK